MGRSADQCGLKLAAEAVHDGLVADEADVFLASVAVTDDAAPGRSHLSAGKSRDFVDSFRASESRCKVEQFAVRLGPKSPAGGRKQRRFERRGRHEPVTCRNDREQALGESAPDVGIVRVSCGAGIAEPFDGRETLAERDRAGENWRRKDAVFGEIGLDAHDFVSDACERSGWCALMTTARPSSSTRPVTLPMLD